MMNLNPGTCMVDGAGETAAQIGGHLSRRRLMLGLMSSVAALPALGHAGISPLSMPLHFLPAGRGAADGSDWPNAAPLEKVAGLAADAAPGQVFLVAVDASTMPLGWSGTQISWYAAGAADAPTHLRFGVLSASGLFEQPQMPDATAQLLMLGNETGPDERPDVGGEPHVVFGSGSSYLQISGPVYDRSGGEGFYNLDVQGTARDLGFSNIHARNVGRVIETEPGTRIEGLSVEDCSALGLIRGFARFRDLSQAQFRNLDLDADFVDGGGGMVCQIISVTKGRELTFENVRLAKAVNTLAARERGSRYIQGDGLVLEEETHDVRIDNCHASDMGDGGFDLKTENVQVTNCTTTRCKLGIRIWSHHPGNLIENCRMTEPVWRPYNDGSCLWVAGSVTVRDCVMQSVDEMSPIRFGDGRRGTPEARLRIEGGTIEHADGVSLATGSAGEIELENVVINGVEISGRYRWTGRRLRRL